MADPVKPLKSYSAQINFDITIWNGSWVAIYMANTSCNWCQKKEDKLNIVRKINLIYGFPFFWDALYSVVDCEGIILLWGEATELCQAVQGRQSLKLRGAPNMASAQVQRESKAHEAGQGGIMQGRIGGGARKRFFGASIAPPSISATDMHPSPNVWKIEIRCFFSCHWYLPNRISECDQFVTDGHFQKFQSFEGL